MKLPPFGPSTRTSLLACASLCAITTSAFAASQTWDGDTDANWTTAGNWSGDAVPGINPTSNATNTADAATFNAANGPLSPSGSQSNPVINDGTAGNISSNRMIGRIVFDTAAAGAYHIGAAGSTTTLQYNNNPTSNPAAAALDVTATVVNPQTINAPVALHLPSSTNGFGVIQNNSTTSTATLTLAGGILNSPNSSRGTGWTLRGTNTGENTVSGNITITNTGGQTSSVTKTDAGTWVLSGNNTFPSGGGVIVNDGLLVAASNTALGQNGTANAQAMAINGGVLEIRSGLTINNGVSLNLNNGGTIRAAGTTATEGRINVSTAAGASVTIATTAPTDVFTIGNGTNDFAGGSSTAVVHITGPGTVYQSVSSNYLGSWSIDGGTLSLGSPTALGPAASASVVSIANGAKLKTMGNNITVVNMTGSGTISNGSAIDNSVVTLNNSSPVSFGGAMVDEDAGTLGLIKTGPGTLNLSGASNYTDATSLNTGTLNLTGSLGNTALTVGTGATLSGNGTTTGGVTVSTGGHIAPGDGGDANLGTLTVGTLALDFDSQLDFGITDTATLDKITVSNSGGLTINGGQVNINGAASQFTANGVYNLIGFSGAIGGSGVSSLSVNGLNKSVTKNYTFGTSGGFVTMTVSNSGAVQNFWNLNADGNWSVGSNWTPGVPNSVGAFAGFGGGGTEITAARTITVNGAFTVGTLAFNGAANNGSYTLAAGTGAAITLDNGVSGAFVTDSAGSHTINSPLTLTGNGATFTVLNALDTLTVGGAIDGTGNPLVKGGAGTLALNGVNTYTSGTTINAGTLSINNASSLGDALNTTTLNAATLRTTADIVSTGFLRVGDAASSIAVLSGTTFTVDGVIEDAVTVGKLTKADAGTLALNGFNTYSGGTVVNGGILQINNASSLGNALGSLTLNEAILEATASFTGTRDVILGHANSRIVVDPGQTYTINGPISGSGTLNLSGDGTLSLGSNANNWSGGTVLNAGILAMNLNATLGTGTVLFQGGTLQNNYGNNTTFGLNRTVSVPAGQTGTINMGNRMTLSNPVTGSGTLNVNLNTTATRDDFSNSWSGFTGQLNVAGNGTGRLLNNGGGFDPASMVGLTLDLGGNAFLQSVTNSGGNTYSIGALSGASATAGFAGGTAGRATLSIGELDTSSSFAGQINGNTALIKVGTGTLTLTGSYNYTGNTTVQEGTLSLATGTLSDIASVSIATGAVLNLTFDGTDGVDELILEGVEQQNGVYGAVGSGAQFETPLITGTGRIEVLPDDPFAAWIAQFPTLTGADAEKGADPDHDGLTNLEELAFDGNPTTGTDTGKVRVQVATVGADQALVITLPVRNGAVFGGTPSKTATINEIIYTISGSNTLADAFNQGVTEIGAITAGMPALNTGWTYRSFRLDGAIGGATPRGPVGFLRATIADAAP